MFLESGVAMCREEYTLKFRFIFRTMYRLVNMYLTSESGLLTRTYTQLSLPLGFSAYCLVTD